MNIAITDSHGQKFDLLTRQIHDVIIWEVNDTLTLIYILNKKTFEEITEIIHSLKLKIASDKFANPEAYLSIHRYEGKSTEICEFFKKNFGAGIEKIPKYGFK